MSNVGGHADGNTGSAVNEQVGERTWENCRLGPRFIVIRDEIDSVLLHVDHERSAEMRHARFGVPHRCRWIALDRAEIPLAIDQPFAHRPRLRHVHERGVNHRFAVRVIISAGVTANFCAFAVLPPWEKRQIVHRVENSSLRWLESVARVRQRA